MSKIARFFAPLSLVAAGAANAAVDPSITTAVTAAQQDSLAVAGLVTGMAVVIWGALFVKRKFFG